MYGCLHEVLFFQIKVISIHLYIGVLNSLGLQARLGHWAPHGPDPAPAATVAWELTQLLLTHHTTDMPLTGFYSWEFGGGLGKTTLWTRSGPQATSLTPQHNTVLF